MKVTKFAWDLLIFRSLSSKQMLISSSYLRPGRVKFPWNSAFKLAMVLSRTFEVNFSTIKSYKADMKHASWSEQSGCTVTIPTWCRAWLLFQHAGVGLGCSRSGRLITNSFYTWVGEWVSDTFAYRSGLKKYVSTLRLSTSLNMLF